LANQKPNKKLLPVPAGANLTSNAADNGKNLGFTVHDNTVTGVSENPHPGRGFQKCLVSVSWYCVSVWANGQTA